MTELLSSDQQYLIDHGWRLITSSRSNFGKMYYWDHEQYPRSSGRWWTQGNALGYQRRLDRAITVTPGVK